MAGECNVDAAAALVPRHYELRLSAVLDSTAMLELVMALAAIDLSEDACGGFFEALRTAVEEAYVGDRPQPIGESLLPLPGEDDDPDGGVPAATK